MENIRGNGTKGKTITKSGLAARKGKAVILKLELQVNARHGSALSKIPFFHGMILGNQYFEFA